MTPKIILSSEGTLKYVAEWPEQLNSVNYFLAIANAVPFKNQKDEQELKLKLTKQQFPIDSHIDVSKLEHLKPYDVPEGIEIEILSANGENIKHGNLFAFIKAKEEVESQDQLWQEAIKLWLHSETLDELKYRFRIERIKK